MKITDVETLQLRLPEVRMVADGTQDVLIVRVHTDAGITGVGEIHTSPSVAQQIIDAPVSHVRSRGLRGLLLGENPLEITPLWQRMFEGTAVYGRRGIAIHAMSGIDLALWDILGKVTAQPVSVLLGGTFRTRVEPYASVLLPDSCNEVRELARRCLDEGFDAIKFGWGTSGQDLEVDTRRLEAAREAAPHARLMLDVGYGLRRDRALALANRLSSVGVDFLEEPVDPDDLEGLRWLSERSPVRIATGEKESTRYGFRALIDQGRPHIIQPDLARAGGFSECRVIADAADLGGVACVPHCWSTDVLVASTLHFIASRRIDAPLEFCLESNDLRRLLVREPITLRDGKVDVPDGPGLGIVLDEGIVERYCVRRTTAESDRSWSYS